MHTSSAPAFHASSLAALVGALAALTAVGCTLWAFGQIERRKRVRRAARASLAERSAARVLASAGYRIIGRQVRQHWSLLADGRELRIELIADYVVEAGGARYVAEVKTGERALDLRHGPTRRQLLEYRQAFAVQGVLLVDAEGGSIRHVEFSRAAARAPNAGRALGWCVLGVLLGLVLGHLWR